MKASTTATKLFFAGMFLLTLSLIVFVQAAFNLGPFLTPSLPSQILLLYTLSTFVFLVLIIFGFILARSLFKLWIERRSEAPGARFKTRLVVSMTALALVPAAVLFAFAFGLVNRSIDKWFSVPVDKIFETTRQIGDQWSIERERAAEGLLAEIAARPPSDLDGTALNLGLDAIAVLDPGGRVLRQSTGAAPYIGAFRERLAERSGAGPRMASIETGTLVGVMEIGSSQDAYIAAAFDPPEHFDELTRTIAAQQLSYDELIQNRLFYRDTYVYILVLMTILVLFAAVWTGLFLSKRITVPIEALAGATREISAGNLDHRVNIKADDELGMLVGLFNDMAGQLQRTTRQLDERRRYTETILEAIPTGVISIDDEHRITKMNRAARTMFSIEGADSLGDVFTRDDLDHIGQMLRLCQQEGTAAREMTLKANARPVHSAVIASRLAAGGFVVVIEDLTEVVKAQKATAWREVARRLAHEIKNPLTPIQLSAERISRNVDRLPQVDLRTADIIRECVDSIVGEVRSLEELVNEFGRVARLPGISPAPGSIKALVDRTLALYEDRLNGTVVRSEIPEDFPPVLMDGQQIKRVLINLIDNAMEAMSGEQTKALTIGCELVRDGTMARLTVTDTGHGIAPDDRGHLFAPYFSTRRNGTGLGLAIASRIIADHGGYIGAEANGRQGARFVVELPVCRES